jgi:hypothetical protein
MGRPKKSTQRTTSVSSDGSTGNADKLDEILEKLASLDAISTKLSNLEKMLVATQAENKQLKETISAQNVKITDLKDRLNSLEQHGRSFSVRVNNLPLDSAEERDPPAVIKKVYEAVFLPILQGAASMQAISSVPSCYDMIEMAHPLPGRSDKPKPIIVRFFNRNLKAVLFKHRKDFAVKADPGGQGGQVGQRPRHLYPFHDDLTKDTYKKMVQLQGDPRVQSCWSAGGSLRYRLVDNPAIKRVASVYMSNDEILQ